MRIVTSSFSTVLPSTFARLSIARWAPAGDRNLPMVRGLSPGPWFKTVDVPTYRRLYMEQLGRLDPQRVVAEIEDLSAGKPAALLCWEKPTDRHFCHRGFVSAWLKDEIDLDVPKYGLEGEGVGHAHPKLPREFRSAAPAQARLL